MKKTNNKGFSLVELIIVIAIMAILAGAIAPALIKYIDKSRRSNDLSSAKTFKTAVETALGTEEVYETLTNVTSGDASCILLTPNVAIPSSDLTSDGGYMTITGCENPNGQQAGMTDAEICKAIGTNIGEKTPKTKYQKNIQEQTGEKVKTGGFKPETYCAFVTKSGSVYVCVTSKEGSPSVTIGEDGVASFTGCAPLAPEVCKGYQ